MKYTYIRRREYRSSVASACVESVRTSTFTQVEHLMDASERSSLQLGERPGDSADAIRILIQNDSGNFGTAARRKHLMPSEST